MGEKLGWMLRVGRLITLPEAVDKLEDRLEHAIKKVDDVKALQATCVTDDELTTKLKDYKDTQDEKLDLIIRLLNNDE